MSFCYYMRLFVLLKCVKKNAAYVYCTLLYDSSVKIISFLNPVSFLCKQSGYQCYL